PYKKHRAGEPYVGVWDYSEGCAPRWKCVQGAKAVAYLKPSPHLIRQCRTLADHGLNLLVVGDRSNVDVQALEESERISVSKKLIRLEECQRQCSLIVCNANHGMIVKSLSMRIPLAMLPLFIEQRCNARVVEHLGLGVDLSKCAENSWKRRIDDLLGSPEISHRCHRYAEFLERANAGALQRAAGILDRWIEESSPAAGSPASPALPDKARAFTSKLADG
ncbi:MAG: hypothetical protein ACTHK7_12755, partial [Aureliella sp.]